MTEKVSINLDRSYLFLRIAGIIAGALLFCAVIYGQIDSRMDAYEISIAVEKSKVESLGSEIKRMSGKVDKIYDLILAKPNKE